MYRKRWARWQLWLSTILDFLEADWDVCIDLSTNADTGREAVLQESLLWQYLVGQAETINRNMRRRFVKSILAMATPDSLKDFPEVWSEETMEPKKRKNNEQPVREVNFETGDMADYEE